ncbi:helix-turn-helix domain-containing protein [Bacillus rubiinfantis]|uniref:helix-turn-helix domain-containing protein n=1 Tax=Bacillus rubiinfantis TaxID=1499680 RepID=UPI0005A8A54E|nr:XRE family transcriptional regulator [Bacillus rubiinfantis]
MLQGSKIRELRKTKNLTLKDLAVQTGLSTSLLSQIERDLVDPTVTTFWKICETLQVPINYFFQDMEEESLVVRRDSRRIMELSNGNVRYHQLTPNKNGKIEFIMVEIQPGERSDVGLVSHSGEECGFVLQGQLIVNLEGREYFLNEGDSIHFSSSIPHRYFNPGDIPTLSIWTMVPT